MTAVIPAPAYVLARAAWIPTLVIWHADGRFTRLEGAPCDEYVAALGRELAAAPGGVFIGRGWVRRRNAAALRGSC
jgi:hypothetical protein